MQHPSHNIFQSNLLYSHKSPSFGVSHSRETKKIWIYDHSFNKETSVLTDTFVGPTQTNANPVRKLPLLLFRFLLIAPLRLLTYSYGDTRVAQQQSLWDDSFIEFLLYTDPPIPQPSPNPHPDPWVSRSCAATEANVSVLAFQFSGCWMAPGFRFNRAPLCATVEQLSSLNRIAYAIRKAEQGNCACPWGCCHGDGIYEHAVWFVAVTRFLDRPHFCIIGELTLRHAVEKLPGQKHLVGNDIPGEWRTSVRGDLGNRGVIFHGAASGGFYNSGGFYYPYKLFRRSAWKILLS